MLNIRLSRFSFNRNLIEKQTKLYEKKNKIEVKSMVYIVTKLWYPPEKASEVGKIYLETMKKYPVDKSLEKQVVRAAFHAKPEGIYAFSVTTIKGSVKDVLQLANKRLLMMTAGVEGIRYEFNICLDLGEAMPLIGLEAPE